MYRANVFSLPFYVQGAVYGLGDLLPACEKPAASGWWLVAGGFD
jgi:hypothetical protein